MVTVYSAPTITLVSIYRHILEDHGIICWVKNEYLFAGAGELPPIECWPQLCVQDEDLLEAKRIVAEALARDNTDAGSWRCGSCGEVSEGQFTECWNCGKSRV